jgi:hypothetical protein
VRPLNAQYEAGGAAAGSRAGRGRRGDAHDALTIATTNRYTYALGQAGVRFSKREGRWAAVA